MEDIPSYSDDDSIQTRRAAPRWPAFVWHHKLHLLRDESLYYWRLAFAPTYDRDAVAAGLTAAAERHGIQSLMSYEIFGAYDLLIRVWLPQACLPDYFHATLTNELAPAGLGVCDSFAVANTARHWLFGEDLAEPSDSALDELQRSEIQQIESDFEGSLPQLRERLERQNILRAYRHEPDAPGIKFGVAITGDPELNETKVQELAEDVEHVLDRADVLAERSLYVGSGFGRLLVMGRVSGDAFHALHTSLISQINVAAIREKYDLHTITLVSGQRGFHVAKEGLAQPSAAGDFDEYGSIEPLSAEDANESDAMVFRRVAQTRSFFARLQVGEIFADRFEIKEYLGGGGYAYVYRVYDCDEKVDRAVKIFPSDNPEAALRELAALRTVEHPNVVKLFWYQRAPGCCFLVNEYIDGRSLDELGTVEARQALEITVQILAALLYLHPKTDRIAELKEKGQTEAMTVDELAELQRLQDHALIHRDIKPANIMLRHDGIVKIVDFNIASRASEPVATQSHTPGYVPPDHRSNSPTWEPDVDLYGCGVVLYEMICGRGPYLESADESSIPTDPCELVPDLAPSVGRLLVKACAANRSARFSSAREMADAVTAEIQREDNDR
jgi:Protein kinase domain